jgi:hypothetical protein
MHIVLALYAAVQFAGCGGASQTVEDGGVAETGLSHSPPPSPAKAWWHDSLIAMFQDADWVGTAQVISQKTYSVRANWLPRSIIATAVTVKAGRTLKGDSADTLQIEIVGGCLEGTCLDKSHEAKFENGERALLFLKKASTGKFIVTHGESGKICLDGRYVRRNNESIEISEADLLAVLSNTGAQTQEVRP